MPRIQPKWAIKLIIIEIHNKSTEILYNNKKLRWTERLFILMIENVHSWKLERTKG